MKISEIVTETVGWKFKRSTLTESEFSRSYQLMWRREMSLDANLKFRPAPLLATYLESVRTNTVTESVAIKNLQRYQRELSRLDRRYQIKLSPGNKISVLQYWPHVASNVIEVRGNRVPKEIAQVFYDDAGHVDWIEFSDGSTYPDREFLSHGQGGGEWDGITTLFFPDEKVADIALTQSLLLSPDNWTVSTQNLSESVISEASGYIPSEAERNDPRFKRFKESLNKCKNDINELISNAPSYEQYYSNRNIKESYHQTLLKFLWDERGIYEANDFIKFVMNAAWKSKILYESADMDDARTIIKKFKKINIDNLKTGDPIDVVMISVNQATSVISINIFPNQHFDEYQNQSDGNIMFSADNKIYVSSLNIASEKIITLATKSGQAEIAMTMIRLMTCGGRICKYNDWFIDIDGQNFATRFNDKLNEASGYIPSEAERNDPRFSTALTVDIKPDTMKRNAKKLGWKIARDGRPPLLRP